MIKYKQQHHYNRTINHLKRSQQFLTQQCKRGIFSFMKTLKDTCTYLSSDVTNKYSLNSTEEEKEEKETTPTALWFGICKIIQHKHLYHACTLSLPTTKNVTNTRMKLSLNLLPTDSADVPFLHLLLRAAYLTRQRNLTAASKHRWRWNQCLRCFSECRMWNPLRAFLKRKKIIIVFTVNDCNNKWW